MDEVIKAIKLVKCYGWEEPFARLVAAYRGKETTLLAQSSVIKSLNLALVFVLPPLIAIAIVSVSPPDSAESAIFVMLKYKYHARSTHTHTLHACA